MIKIYQYSDQKWSWRLGNLSGCGPHVFVGNNESTLCSAEHSPLFWVAKVVHAIVSFYILCLNLKKAHVRKDFLRKTRLELFKFFNYTVLGDSPFEKHRRDTEHRFFGPKDL
ncbi:hypothetical protein C4565_08350 [Candidatus Parcubacteria bacterium]|nr:MAG: hypothetical protein C4565_08350 [Candidatus Parcubacteria bacterium]